MAHFPYEQERAAAMVEPLLAWYDSAARILPWRENPTPYRVWVSEIMLQQTRVEAVKPYFDRFINELPDILSLANAKEERLMKLWEGLGYYNRARNMKKAAQMVINQHNGQIPSTYEQLLSLPGIGPYTAGAIASIAYGKVVAAVDGNVLRVLSRVMASDKDITKTEVKKDYITVITQILPKNRAGDFNQAMMEHGATICLPNGMPLCEQCPIASLCLAFQRGRMMQFPVKKPKRKRKVEERTVFVIRYADKTALRQRSELGLLAKMWELPNVEGALSEDGACERLYEWGILVKNVLPLKDATHIFTHIEWHMKGYLVHVREDTLPPDWVWADQAQRLERYALPSAFRAFFV